MIYWHTSEANGMAVREHYEKTQRRIFRHASGSIDCKVGQSVVLVNTLVGLKYLNSYQLDQNET